MKLKKILQIKDFFAVFLFLELTMVLIYNDVFKIEYLGIYLLPIVGSSLVWNKWLYIALMDDKDALYSKSNLSFFAFIVIGLIFIVLAVVAFLYFLVKGL